MVQVNQVGAPSNAYVAKPSVATHTAPNPLYLTSLEFGKKSSGGLFSSIWSGIKTIFSTIFCCCSRSKDAEATSPEQLKELQSTFTALRGEFLSNRGKMRAEQLTAWWKPKFEGLTKIAQRLIMIEDMKGWARYKEREATEDQVLQYAKSCYENEDFRAKSLIFVRDLNTQTNSDGSEEKIPASDNFVPRYLAEIIKSLDAQMQKTEE